MRSSVNPYFETRLAAERDRRLSAGAFRLLCCICTHRAGRDLEDDFPLPWSTVGDWLEVAKDQSYRMISQLVDAGYLKPGELKRCPAERFYFLLPSCRKNAPTGSRKNAPTGGRKKSPASFRKNASPHTSIPSGKEVSQRIEGREEVRPAAGDNAGKDNSALRAGGQEGFNGAVPAGKEPDGQERQRIDWDRLKREALA
jgi:hypothetical protein